MICNLGVRRARDVFVITYRLSVRIKCDINAGEIITTTTTNNVRVACVLPPTRRNGFEEFSYRRFIALVTTDDPPATWYGRGPRPTGRRSKIEKSTDCVIISIQILKLYDLFNGHPAFPSGSRICRLGRLQFGFFWSNFCNKKKKALGLYSVNLGPSVDCVFQAYSNNLTV